MKIVDTDNFGGDYPAEKFLNLPPLPEDHCKKIANAINDALGPNATRFYKVVPNDYKLAPGFEP